MSGPDMPPDDPMPHDAMPGGAVPGGAVPGGPMATDEALAADFALGALTRDEQRAAELRLARDPAFAAMVASWQALLAPLADGIAPVAPPPGVWDRIAATVIPAQRQAPAAPGFWSRVATWRALTAAASTVAAAAVALLLARPAPPPPVSGALLTAAMAPTGKPGVLINATFDPVRGAVILTPAAADASAGRTPELWVIVGKAPPRSLGVIDLAAPQAHRIPADLRPLLARGVTLAISLEPAGGSPTGQPTGPVVAAGTLAAI